MIGFGTLINIVGILIGGCGGILFGKKLSGRYQQNLMTAIGLCILFLGISGSMEEMLLLTDDGLASQGTMMLIASLAIGALIGEWINLEYHMEQFGDWLKRKTKNTGDVHFVNGFVTTSLTICIGAMAVVGSIQDGVSGDYSILTTKAILDLVIVMVMTASLGKGCIFAAIPVALFQGTITLLATFLQLLLTGQALANLSLTGSVLIFCVGVNLVFGKKIKVANLLPAIIIAVLYAYLPLS